VNLEELKKENLDLKRKLSIAKLWIEKEIKSKVTKIAKWKISQMTSKTKDVFFAENVEDIITKKVSDYFWEIMILNTPQSVIENIISAEVSYYNLRENPNADGLGVITSYHKSLDSLVESLIIKWFRKYAHKKWQIQLRQNDVLEKALNSVVNKGYSLSIWRLFHLVKLIKTDDILYDYWKCFKEYLEKYSYISDILFKDEFYSNFEKLVGSEILWKKRHIWRISFVEARRARTLLIWDFTDQNGLIYKFIEIGKVDY
jgi:hypothetical protein